jgi:hypothetical protein
MFKKKIWSNKGSTTVVTVVKEWFHHIQSTKENVENKKILQCRHKICMNQQKKSNKNARFKQN